MNKIFRLSVLCFATAIVFSACTKEENKIYFEEGTPPVLASDNTASLVLVRDNAGDKAVTFEWTNPEYRFNTGVSSQDVTYTLQVDTAGADFTSSSMQELSISKDLSVTYTVQQLNGILTKLDVKEDVSHPIEFRIVSSLGNNSVPLTSNVIGITITPYLDVAVPIPPTGELYITGDGTASGWTNAPPETQKCEMISNTEFSIVTHFKPGFYYKFLSTQNQWQPQYGGNNATGGDIGFNMGLPGQKDPDAIPTPSDEGDYKVDLNFKTGKYTVTKQ
jgi:hypothetical protein